MRLKPADRINERIEILASLSESADFLYRPFCSGSAAAVNEVVRQWTLEDGLEFHLDAMANVRLRTSDFDPAKKTFVVGSHLDTVIDAGKYDGPLGFLIAYEMLLYYRQQQVASPFNLEVTGFSDEEGVRFQTTYLGSRALAGSFEPEWLSLKDPEGISMQQALQDFGCNPDLLNHCCIAPAKLLGYFEVHIEQGPVLQEYDLPVGLVSDVYGQIRISFNIAGQPGHAGTVPMHLRRDALAGFAEFLGELESYALERKEMLVATIGQCKVSPGASNVIPGRVDATIDIRSYEMNLLDRAAADLRQLLQEIVDRRRLTTEWQEVQRTTPVFCNEALNDLLRKAIAEHQDSVPVLSSGAGHDGVAIAPVAPISMLFVRCRDGLSHHPDEFVSEGDIDTALQVSLSFLQKLKYYYQNEETYC